MSDEEVVEQGTDTQQEAPAEPEGAAPEATEPAEPEQPEETEQGQPEPAEPQPTVKAPQRNIEPHLDPQRL